MVIPRNTKPLLKSPFGFTPRQPVVIPPSKDLVTVPDSKLIGIFAAVDDDSKRLVKYYGSELLLNSGFDDASIWITGGGWDISAGKLNNAGVAGTFTYQSIVIPTSGKYKLEIQFGYWVSGDSYAYLDPDLALLTNMSCDGIYKSEGLLNAGATTFYLQNYNDCDNKFFYASLKQVLYREDSE